MEPGVEPVGLAKPGQVTPRPHQRVLDRVARELRVPKDEARGRIVVRPRLAVEAVTIDKQGLASPYPLIPFGAEDPGSD